MHHRRGAVLGRLLFAILVLTVIGGSVFAFARRDSLFGKRRLPGGLLTKPVERGTLKISLTESGSLESAANITLASQVEGSAVIIKIAEEGTRATPGQVLVELDSANFRTQATQQQIKLEQALAALKKAEEDLAIQEKQNESDLAAVDLKIKLANLDLKKYEQGDYVLESSTYQGEQTLAREELRRATEKYEYTKRLAKKGYATQAELEADRIAVESAKIKSEAAKQKQRVLDEYTLERTLEEKKANCTEYVRERERVLRKAESLLAQFRANLSAAKLTADVEKRTYDKLLAQIEFCTIKAPQEGLVVYANLRNQRGSQDVIIQEGAMVRERQAIINLPDVTRMQVNAKIHESKIDMVREGLKVLIRVDARPSEVFHGTISTVSLVPLSGNWPNFNLKEYSAIVRIDDAVEKVAALKPGLTAQVEILVDQIPNALFAPIQSVIQRGNKSFVFVVVNEKVERREVKAGKSSDSFTEIQEGLKEGDLAVVNPRGVLTDEVKKLDAEFPAAADDTKTPTEFPKSSAEEKSPTDAGGRDLAKDAGKRGEGRGPGATGPGPGSGGGSYDPAQRFKQMDANGDGKLTADEMPERMRDRFDSMDSNSDQSVDLSEYTQAMQAFMKMMQQPSGGGFSGPPGGGAPTGGGSGSGGGR